MGSVLPEIVEDVLHGKHSLYVFRFLVMATSALQDFNQVILRNVWDGMVHQNNECAQQIVWRNTTNLQLFWGFCLCINNTNHE